jgi:RNA polymerase sigma factor (sigma-70 family)
MGQVQPMAAAMERDVSASEADLMPAGIAASGTDGGDRAILREIGAGQLQRFDVLVNRYKTRLFRFIYVRLGDLEAAEDLTQDVFIKMMRGADVAGDSRAGTVSTWLFTVARNCLTDHVRACRRRENLRQAAIRLTPRATSIDPVTAASLEEERTRVGKWLNQLPEEQREVLSLRLLADLTVPEIAEVTGVGVATVKSRLRYGLSKVAEMLEKENNL